MKKILMLCAAAAVAAIAATSLPVARATSLQSAGVRPLTIETLIDIRHPSNPVWSPDGRMVAFLSERAGIANIYVAEAPGGAGRATGTGARAVTAFPEGHTGGFFWSADSQRIYLPRQGDSGRYVVGGQPSAV